MPAVLWTALIAWFSAEAWSAAGTGFLVPLLASLVPWAAPEQLKAGVWLIRKCAHFVEYAVLSMLTFRALRHTLRGQAGRQLLAGAVAVSIACASLDELHQYLWTRNRTGTPKDVVLDTVGAFAGAVVGATYLYRRITRRAA